LTNLVNGIKKAMGSVGWLVSDRKWFTSQLETDGGAILPNRRFRRDSGFSKKLHNAWKLNLMVQKQFMDTEKAGK